MSKFNQKTCKTVRLVFGIVMSVYTVVLAALILWRVLDVYFTGAAAGNMKPYTYEAVMGRAHGELAAPFWVWIGLIFAGLVLWEVFYVPEKRRGISDARYILQRLQKRIPAEVGDDLKDSLQAVKREQEILKITHLCLYALTAAFLVYVIAYMCIPSNFTSVETVTQDIKRICLFILPLAAVVYVAWLTYVIYYGYSARRQLPEVKKLTKGIKEPQSATGKFAAFVQSKNFILAVRIAVACFAVTFIIIGCFNGSVQEVLNKAIRICTECIGLG